MPNSTPVYTGEPCLKIKFNSKPVFTIFLNNLMCSLFDEHAPFIYVQRCNAMLKIISRHK